MKLQAQNYTKNDHRNIPFFTIEKYLCSSFRKVIFAEHHSEVVFEQRNQLQKVPLKMFAIKNFLGIVVKSLENKTRCYF